MGRIEDLAHQYLNQISIPWQKGLSGPQRCLFVVYDKADERKLRAKLDLFEMNTRQSGHGWKLFDLTGTFARWMGAMEYRESYFEEPADLKLKLEKAFVQFAAAELREALTAPEVDENTVVAAHGAGSLFGFTLLSLVLEQVHKDIRGRLILFFPGVYENGNYRLLDARDGWNYLAVPITLDSGVT